MSKPVVPVTNVHEIPGDEHNPPEHAVYFGFEVGPNGHVPHHVLGRTAVRPDADQVRPPA